MRWTPTAIPLEPKSKVDYLSTIIIWLGSIMFHVRRRPADSQPRRRKKKTTGVGAGCGAGGSSARPGCEPMLVEVAPDGSPLENGRRVRITGDLLEVGSGNGSALQLYGPSIQPRHCLVAAGEAGGFTATPLHADAQVYVNGRRAVAPHSLPLQHGCLLKFGRVSTFRFMDPNQENLLNRNLSQSQHFGSGSIYDRSGSALAEGEEGRATSPARGGSPASPASPAGPDDPYQYRDANDTLTPYNNNTLKLDNDSVLSHASRDDYLRDDHASHRNNNSNYKDNYETTFDLDGNVETKSICSAKSGGSGHDNRMSATVGSAARPGQEAILPAVLEFPEAGQAQFLAAVITRLDPHAPAFKLAPVYTLYLCARYRASTHYRPELTPTERAHKLTAFLHHVATLIHATVQERCTDSAAQAFWMANASELLHFLKCDRHISSFSTQAQELLPATLVTEPGTVSARWGAALAARLALLPHNVRGELLARRGPADPGDGFSAEVVRGVPPGLAEFVAPLQRGGLCRLAHQPLARGVWTVYMAGYGAAARRPPDPAVHIIQLNKNSNGMGLSIVAAKGAGQSKLGIYIKSVVAGGAAAADGRLAAGDQLLSVDGQSLVGITQEKRIENDLKKLTFDWYRTGGGIPCADGPHGDAGGGKQGAVLHGLATLLHQPAYNQKPGEEEGVQYEDRRRRNSGTFTNPHPALLRAASPRSELATAGNTRLLCPCPSALLYYNVRGELLARRGPADPRGRVQRGGGPRRAAGLAEFVAPLQRGGLCRLAHQPLARGVWTVYMAGYGAAARRPPDPAVHIIQLNKNSNGMGLSIVAAKGAGQSKLGIYIKSVVAGGAAAADGRLAAGDQLLSVDGQSLVGITQEKAADTCADGPHGDAGGEEEGVQYEDRRRRNSGTFTNPHPALLRAASPRSELATAGNTRLLCPCPSAPAFTVRLMFLHGYRRPCHDRCHLLRDESTESSTSESEECRPHYHGSIPRLIITLDRENNQLREDASPDTPGCPLELHCAPPRPVPIFTFTCEDFDEQQASDTGTYDSHVPRDDSPPPPPAPPAPPRPPSPPRPTGSDSGEPARLPPQMRPIDTRLTLELFRSPDAWRGRRCTAADECVSACSCCRAPQPEAPLIPFIDEPALEPLIAEQPPPRTRRILPALSLDRTDDAPQTVDAGCQTPAEPMDVDEKESYPTPPQPHSRKLDLKLDLGRDTQTIGDMHCRLKRALFNMSKTYSKSEDAGGPSTSESFDDTTNDKYLFGGSKFPTPAETGAKQVLDSVDRKSWKSPDEYRPAFGRVRALTKQFNDINLRYCAKNYKRNCQSSPNLSCRNDKTYKPKENIPTSASLIDIQYESLKTDTSESRGEKMSEEEVKSILIQLEDWSRYGSRGSGDTLAQGNEFELPNLPDEQADISDQSSRAPNTYVFNEIPDTTPRIITLDNIRLKSNQSSVNLDQTKHSKESLKSSEEITTQKSGSSLINVSNEDERSSRRASLSAAQSCPDVRARPLAAALCCCCRSCLHLAGPNVSCAQRARARRVLARYGARRSATCRRDWRPSPVSMHSGSASVANVAAASAAGAGAAAWAGRSRSSHNLNAAPHDGFYQNLPAHEHALQDRNRPQSAHYAPAPLDAPASPASPASPAPPQHHVSNPTDKLRLVSIMNLN
ncbi:hypothetical protein MSG28_007380 [Choristoneura fumiferana]|uniref:Uncharacterized protein n=1 Tax=Choristoneura fumiferana TaxID=7141 RepID=A0ACC0JXH2_CHOFU|nr:hypothetical protein MSG28_007380 [Choristoneura fumiferana]